MDDDLPHPLRPPRPEPPAGNPRFRAMWERFHGARLDPGWWLLPMMIGGAACWVAIVWTLAMRLLP